MIEYGHNIEGEVKVIKTEIKEILQGTNSEGKKTRLKSTVWSRRKK